MNRLTGVEARGGYTVWLRFADGVEGTVDLADLAERGVFAAWKQRPHFEAVHVGPGGCAAWPGELELCPDSLYLRLTGKRPEESFPPLVGASAGA